MTHPKRAQSSAPPLRQMWSTLWKASTRTSSSLQAERSGDESGNLRQFLQVTLLVSMQNLEVIPESCPVLTWPCCGLFVSDATQYSYRLRRTVIGQHSSQTGRQPRSSMFSTPWIHSPSMFGTAQPLTLHLSQATTCICQEAAMHVRRHYWHESLAFLPTSRLDRFVTLWKSPCHKESSLGIATTLLSHMRTPSQ